MKTFNREHLPESRTIEHNGQTYHLNVEMSGARSANNTSLDHITAELKKQGRKAVLVKVLSENLKGKLDLHNKPYKPTEWLFTTNAADKK